MADTIPMRPLNRSSTNRKSQSFGDNWDKSRLASVANNSTRNSSKRTARCKRVFKYQTTLLLTTRVRNSPPLMTSLARSKQPKHVVFFVWKQLHEVLQIKLIIAMIISGIFENEDTAKKQHNLSNNLWFFRLQKKKQLNKRGLELKSFFRRDPSKNLLTI